jgi:hypothetical protein
MDKQKIRAKLDEMLVDTDPLIASRVVAIFNDAVASVPPAPVKEVVEKPEVTLAKTLKQRVNTVVASSDTPPELAEKLKALLSEVEAEPVEPEDVPEPEPQPQPAA